LDKGWKEAGHVKYHLREPTAAGKVFGFFEALGAVAFAYAGHNVVLEIQATIPSTPEMPSKKPMWKGVVVAYVIIALQYFPVALVGYWALGNTVDDNILITLKKPKWLIAIANMMVVLHVVGSYQVYAMPVFDMIEMVLVKKLRFPPGLPVRLVARTAYVGNISEIHFFTLKLSPSENRDLNSTNKTNGLQSIAVAAFTMFIAITFPFFGGLLGFFGGFAFAPTTYFVSIPNPFRFHYSNCEFTA
jgi:hypothetical protein